ncbi:magnesium transporter MgtE N-terminal domain-containing protein [Thermoleptolyngbya sp.]
MADSTLIALKQDISTAFTHLRSIEERARSLAEIDLEKRLLAFELLGEGLAIAVLNHLPPAIQVELLQSMDATALMRVLEEMEPQDRQQLLASLPREAIDGLIAKLTEAFQATVSDLFSFSYSQPASSVTPTHDNSDFGLLNWWEVADWGD